MADEEFMKALEASPEIELTVTGRTSGREISNPLWFVWEGEKLYLVPVKARKARNPRNPSAPRKRAVVCPFGAHRFLLLPKKALSLLLRDRAGYTITCSW